MKKNPEVIVEELKQILVNDLFVDLPIDRMRESDLLATGIGLDSVGLIELVMLVEEKYAITIEERRDVPSEEKTLGWFASYIASKLPG
jgi:acyl carrier protein